MSKGRDVAPIFFLYCQSLVFGGSSECVDIFFVMVGVFFGQFFYCVCLLSVLAEMIDGYKLELSIGQTMHVCNSKCSNEQNL
jgi:hypothetical protein